MLREMYLLIFASLMMAGCVAVKDSEPEAYLVEGAARAHIYSLHTNLYAKGCINKLNYDAYRIQKKESHMDGIQFREYTFKPIVAPKCATEDEVMFYVYITDDKEVWVTSRAFR